MSKEIALERIKIALENNHKILDLSHLGLTQIPEEIVQLSDLQYLFLEHNQIADLEELKDLKKLKVLGLSQNQLVEAPAFLLELGIPFCWKDFSLTLFITELVLARIRARALTRDRDQANALTRDRARARALALGLARARARALTLRLALVRVLDLDRALDLATGLDLALAPLSRTRAQHRVQDLYLAQALDQALDRALDQTRDLYQARDLHQTLAAALDLALDLDRTHNELLTIILEFLNDQNTLSGIYLIDNPLKYPSPELILQGINAIKIFFTERLEQHSSLNEVKVILVGEGGSGKTSLVKRLCHKKFDKKESQTHGIRISKQPVVFQKQPFLVNFWDFGGQEIMHATHQFFLTKRCLYILVLDSRKDEKAEYWLNYIESFGGASPVIVVLNKMDENPSFNVNRSFLSKKYPNVQGFYKLSCNDGTGLNDLKKDLLKQLWNLELREYILPKSWINTKTALEEMQEDFIGYAQYQKICEEKKVKDEASQKVLLELLNDLGVVLNYEKLRWFDTQVLNPLWLTNAVYRIINSPILAKSNGRFNINDLDAIINDKRYQKENPEYDENISKNWEPAQKLKKFPEEKFLFIVAMMKQFEILFQLDDLHYLVPVLLPDEEQTQPFEEEENVLSFMIEYHDFLPAAIIPRLMVKLHKYIYQEQRWKTGMVLQEKTLFHSIANIVLDKESRQINIEVKGERNRDFLTVIRETLREINSSYQNLNVIEWVLLPNEYSTESVLVKYKELQGHENAKQEQFFSGELQKSFPVTTLLNEIEKPEIRQGLRPCHIFISYAHQDQKYKEKLMEHLSPLFRLNRVSLWDDTCIDAGEEWLNEIYENLEKAQIVLCLISSSFIHSDFCYTEELSKAMEAHDQGKKVVIPIRLKEVNWDNLPISQLQGLPKNKWIRNLSDHKSWTDIAKGIEVVLDKITRSK